MRFGPAGYPAVGNKSDPEKSLQYTRELGLDALEVEFVRGARITEERAKSIGQIAKNLDIRLSCHAPYFISFNSETPETIDVPLICEECGRPIRDGKKTDGSPWPAEQVAKYTKLRFGKTLCAECGTVAAAKEKEIRR